MQHIGLVGVIALAVVTGVTVAASSIATGQQTETALDEVLDGPPANESTAGWALDGVTQGVKTFAAGLEGGRQRVGWWLTHSLPGMDSDYNASEIAAETTAIWNANNRTLDAYGNDRRDWSENRTVRVTWHVDGETATRYVVANVSNGSVATMMTSTELREPTESVDLCGYAAVNSPDALEHFIDAYAEPGEAVDAAYLARMNGKYAGDVDSTLYATSGDCSATTNETTQEVTARAR